MRPLPDIPAHSMVVTPMCSDGRLPWPSSPDAEHGRMLPGSAFRLSAQESSGDK